MNDVTRRRLAQAFVGWQRRRNVSFAHIARYGDVALNTLRYIRTATGGEVSRSTLRKIADGLATESYPPHPRDASMADQIYRDLHRAAEYGEVPTDLPDTFLETGLFYEIGTMEQAHAWYAAIRRLRGLRPDEIDRLQPAPDRATG